MLKYDLAITCISFHHQKMTRRQAAGSTFSTTS